MLKELKKQVFFLHHSCNETVYETVLQGQIHAENLNEYELIANAPSKNAGDIFFLQFLVIHDFMAHVPV